MSVRNHPLSSENTAALRTAFRKGMEGLLELALEHAGLTTERIHELYEMRFSTINPVVDISDKCIGEQWWSTPNFWEGGVDDAATIRANPPETFFHLTIYGELFGPAFDVFLKLDTIPEAANAETRLELVKYCIPDWLRWAYQSPAWGEDGRVDPRRAVQPVGPYSPLVDDDPSPPGLEVDGQQWL